MNDRPSTLPLCSRLPVCVDLPLLLRALSRIPAGAWQAHFNRSYYSGQWSGVALISASDALTELAPGQGVPTERPFWLADSAWQQALSPLAVDICSARLLRLSPGSHIHEHRDYDLTGPDADRRLHIPLLSPEGVEFLVEGQCVPMSAGECWFLDLARPHSVDHRGEGERVHLVLDCRPTLWLDQRIQAGLATTPATSVGHAHREFQRFKARLESDPALSAPLQAITDSQTFIAKTLEMASHCGIELSEPTLRAAMRQGRNRWDRQWTH